LSGALIGHRLFATWALALAAISNRRVPGGQLLDTPRTR